MRVFISMCVSLCVCFTCVCLIGSLCISTFHPLSLCVRFCVRVSMGRLISEQFCLSLFVCLCRSVHDDLCLFMYVCLCGCAYVCAYVYLYVCLCGSVYSCVCVYLCLCVSVPVALRAYIRVFAGKLFVCTSVYVRLCLCVCPCPCLCV